jgi:hypothetical protein
MPETPGFSIAAQELVEGKAGATGAFPYDRMTVERLRSAIPGARWRDDLRVCRRRRKSLISGTNTRAALSYIRVWLVSAPVPPSQHRFKYSFFYGRPGVRLVLFDNE